MIDPDNIVEALLSGTGERTRPEGLRAVILAGGEGTRLRPYTSVLPKPRMPLGDRAILEIVIAQLARHGFEEITLSVGHLGHLIEAVFADGADHAVRIDYVREDVALGTAGPLRLIDGLDDTFVTLNGDLVTTFDYLELAAAHKQAGNLLTIATKQRTMHVDYGVLHVDRGDHGLGRIVGFQEKPDVSLTVSMGIYAMEPDVLEFIPEGRRFDFPELVAALLDVGAPVGSFDHNGLWLDIGRHEDYAEASALYESGELARIDSAFAPPSFRAPSERTA
jgi:NDP-sugar pyrophosphorylase family protein